MHQMQGWAGASALLFALVTCATGCREGSERSATDKQVPVPPTEAGRDYARAMRDEPPLQFADTLEVRERGVDENKNGRFEGLVVTVRIPTPRPGACVLSAALRPPDAGAEGAPIAHGMEPPRTGTRWTRSMSYTWIKFSADTTGVTWVPVGFDGDRIRESRASGPFVVTLRVWTPDSDGGTAVVDPLSGKRYFASTAPYRSDQFGEDE